MNKEIKIIKVEDFPSTQLQTVKFELYGLHYFAWRRYNGEGTTTECAYIRQLPNYSWVPKEGIFGEAIAVVRNSEPITHTTPLTDEEFEALRNI